jgi:hypothetical protein
MIREYVDRAIILGAIVLVLSIFAGTSASAQSFPKGQGDLFGRFAFKVKGCDKIRGDSGTTYIADAAGEFVETHATPIVGTLIPQGSSGRVFGVSYDAANTALIESIFADGATLLCGSPYTLGSLQVSASFKLNKRGTRATVRQRATFAGTTAFGSHAGSFKAKDTGAWFAAVP